MICIENFFWNIFALLKIGPKSTINITDVTNYFMNISPFQSICLYQKVFLFFFF